MSRKEGGKVAKRSGDLLPLLGSKKIPNLRIVNRKDDHGANLSVGTTPKTSEEVGF